MFTNNLSEKTTNLKESGNLKFIKHLETTNDILGMQAM